MGQLESPITERNEHHRKTKQKGKNMDQFMEKITDVNVCENMLDQALIENEQMAEKIEMQEELIAKQEAEIEIQKRKLSELKDDLAWANEEISQLEHDNEILKAKMEVVRMIFGGRGNE